MVDEETQIERFHEIRDTAETGQQIDWYAVENACSEH
jgi:hypothetical protein